MSSFTSCGLNGGPLSGTGRYEARIACNLGFREPSFSYLAAHEPDTLHPCFTQSGEDREDDPDQYIANMSRGAWCGFKYFAFDGQTRIRVTTRGNARGELTVSTGRGERPFASVPITPSRDWAEAAASFPALRGTLPLFFTYDGEGTLDFRDFETE